MPAVSSYSLFLEDYFMKSCYWLVLALLILVISPVSAADRYFNDNDLPLSVTYEHQDYIINTKNIPKADTNIGRTSSGPLGIGLKAVETYPEINYLYLEHTYGSSQVKSAYKNIPTGEFIGTYIRPSDNTNQPITVYVDKYYNILGTETGIRIIVFPQNWAIGAKTGTFHSAITFNGSTYSFKKFASSDSYVLGTNVNLQTSVEGGIFFKAGSDAYCTYGLPRGGSAVIGVVGYNYAKNIITITDKNELLEVSAVRQFDGKSHASEIGVYNKDNNLITFDNDAVDVVLGHFDPDIFGKVTIKVPSLPEFNHTIIYESTGTDPGDPGDPTDPVLRTGTVTMTDHNGTSISGFEVTAINHYTGESYSVSTDTDVAVIDLPMDRTTEIRNPQTGEYEKVPIGYYKFYGQAPGYKMMYEDGIQVAVVPEKYSSYQLCNILVRSESGPLTGKHQFQIRSRADNSILQTGTISAQSATTGNWYNTSVSGGIATLILPYDTTSILSEYAGLYKVYATSPGYEENDYGTQISVYPHTVSEIKTVLLTPIGGVSTPDNVTLRIQAVSETGTGVVNAEIFIAGVYGAGKDVWNTYTASSTGYLTLSVPGNSTYDIVASGDGYYDSARRIEVFTEDPGLIELKLYLSGYPTLEPTEEPTGWPTDPPTQPTGGIPDDDDDSDGFLVQAVRGIGLAFGVGFSTAKIIFGMLLALAIGFTTAKQLRGGAAEFGIGLLGGTMLGVLIGLLPVWIVVVLMLVVGLYYGNRYVGGSNSG